MAKDPNTPQTAREAEAVELARGRQPQDPLSADTFDSDPDALTYNNREAGTWSLPSEPPAGFQRGEDPGARLPYSPVDYAGGIVLGDFGPAAAGVTVGGPPSSPHLIRARQEEPRLFQVPHEATHRRFEAPFMVNINQTAPGFSVLAPTMRGLHFVKLIACLITLDVAGTVQFVQGSNDGISTGAISGTINLGIAGGFVLPPSDLATPWIFTTPDLALGIFTVTGKAQGFAVCCYSPYDQ
jgi:hypothetical protein